MGERGKTTPLRDWTEQSYGVDNGRAISSLKGSGNMGNHATGKGRQMPEFKRGRAEAYSPGGPDKRRHEPKGD